MISETFRTRAVVIPALLYLVLSLVSTQLPLLNYLGFEFSFLIAVLSSFIAGFLAIRSIKRSITVVPNHSPLAPEVDDSTRRAHPPLAEITDHAFNAFKQVLVFNLILLIIPLAVMLTNAFFVKNCSLLEGFGFFVLLPVVSVVFSSSLGFLCAVHYRWAKTIFVLVFLATIGYALALGYFTPAIFSYNFFYGFFPGLTYDEALGITTSLLLFRLFTLFVAGVLIWMAVLILRIIDLSKPFWKKGITLLRVMARGRSVIVTTAIAAVLSFVWMFKAELGFESRINFIQKELGGRFESEHFRILYSKESYDDDEIQWIAAEHEFRLKQITDAMSLPFKGKIESYIYPSSEVKQRLMGAGNTNIAKPWSNEIHITQQSLDATLKHELVHVLAAPFGLPVIRASLSTGLVEGLAMAIEWDWGNRTPHEYAAAMRRFGVAPNISSLMTPTGFASQSSSVSYVVTGSFCRYLIDEYSIRKLMQLYRTNDYEAIYGRTLQQLIAEWQQFLDRIPVPEQDRDAIDVLFRRPPIFKKVCARVIAARNIEAAKRFGRRDYKSAAELYMQSFQDGRGYDALGGYIASALQEKAFGGVIAVFDTVIRRSANPAQYIPLFVNVGLAQFGKGNIVTAQELFRRVEVADLGETPTEASLVCAAATNDAVNRDALLRYFTTASNDTQRVAVLDSMVQHPVRHWLPMYLKGKVLLRLQRWNDILSVMNQLEPGIPERSLEAIRLKTIGTALFRLQHFEEAKAAFWNSLNFVSTEVAKNTVNGWVERCEWMKSNFLK